MKVTTAIRSERGRIRLATALIVAAALLAGPAAALEPDEARHLLVRTGFAATPAEITAYLPLSRNQAVLRLLNGVRTEPAVQPPGWVGRPAPFAKIRALPKDKRQAERKKWREREDDLKVWWFREMAETDSPFTERMTLFWHNHFTSEMRKVKAPMLMYRQNAVLRRHAFGNFGDLLRLIAVDPAMLIYLDGRSSRKGNPNENFARELMELFTLGEGHYTERDIKEAARAFTGWTVSGTGEAEFRPARHDGGEKVIFGHRGPFEGHDVVRILLAQERTAAFVVEKLWRAFVSDSPDRDDVQRLAHIFRRADYELKPLMHALLISDAFWTERNRGVLIKSPVALFVGALRQFDLPLRDGKLLVRASQRLGQNLMDPPNVKGWPGGTAWITSDTLVARQEMMERLFRAQEMGRGRAKMMGGRMGGIDLDNWFAALPRAWQHPAAVSLMLLPIAPVDDPTDDPDLRGAPPAETIRRLLLDPTYQLM